MLNLKVVAYYPQDAGSYLIVLSRWWHLGCGAGLLGERGGVRLKHSPRPTFRAIWLDCFILPLGRLVCVGWNRLAGSLRQCKSCLLHPQEGALLFLYRLRILWAVWRPSFLIVAFGSFHSWQVILSNETLSKNHPLSICDYSTIIVNKQYDFRIEYPINI